MAEFCVDCYNHMNGTNDSPKKFVLSDELDLCEGCGEWKRVVIAYKWEWVLWKLRYVIWPFKFVGIIIYVIIKLPWVLWQIYKEHKNKKGTQ